MSLPSVTFNIDEYEDDLANSDASTPIPPDKEVDGAFAAITPLELHQLVEKYFPHETDLGMQKSIIMNTLMKIKNGSRCILIEAPTGAGKSPIATTIANVVQHVLRQFAIKTGPVLAITKTKILQDQYMEKYNTTVLKGKANYPCIVYPLGLDGSTVSYGSDDCAGPKCKMYRECSYVVARNQYMNSDLASFNYALAKANKFATALSSKHLRIFDEAHLLADTLTDLSEIKLNFDELFKRIDKITTIKKDEFKSLVAQYMLKLMLPIDSDDDRKNDKNEQLILDNLSELLGQVSDLMSADMTTWNSRRASLKSRLSSMNDEGLSGSDEARELRESLKEISFNLNTVMMIMKLQLDPDNRNSYVVTDVGDADLTIKFNDPAKLMKEFKSVINILMSATFCGADEAARELGFDNFDIITAEAVIPAKNRPVISLGLPPLNYSRKNELLPMYSSTVEKLCGTVPNKRGIIHTVTYDNARQIYNMVSKSLRSRMHILEAGTVGDIEDILMRSPNTIVLSPSIVEGVDLRGELSEFQIIFKVPYAFLGDRMVKKNMERNRVWYNRRAVRDIVQACGRSVRGSTDSAVTFILDQSFNRLYNNNRGLFPTWFQEAVHIK